MSEAAGSSADAVPAQWQPGLNVLGLYEVTGVLGAGGTGMVHRVHHRAWNVELAVKSPHSELWAGPGGVEAFVTEAERWVNLPPHPNICACHYVRVLGGIPRVFAEYVEGGSLVDHLRTDRLTDLASLLDVAIQMAWALAVAHRAGLVHQDVKPGNVLLAVDGVAKLTDFGLARAQARAQVQAGSEVDGDSPLVSRGGMTRAYASPEQFAGERLSQRTDVWSWAVTVLELFVGHITWPVGPSAGAALEEYHERKPDASRPAMPEGLVALLRRCFSPKPAQRPADLDEVAATLIDLYRLELGEPYPRSRPDAAQHLADGLNNRALSMLDLGREAEAERLWEEALAAEPHHPDATYNRGLYRWRQSLITDDELVRQFEEVRASHPDAWLDDYLLALIHLERGDPEAALPLLRDAALAAPDSAEVTAALQTARDRQLSRSGHPTSLKGHTDSIESVALTPDAHFAASGGRDGTVRFWDLSTGRCLHTFTEKESSYVYCVALTPDGSHALSGSLDHAIRFWDLTAGRCVRTLKGHGEPVVSVALTPDGARALSGSGDRTVRLWDLATGRCLATLKGHTEYVRSVALTPDGRFALSGGSDRTIRLWQLTDWGRIFATGRSQRVLEADSEGVRSVALTPDARFGLSGGFDEEVKFWDLTNGFFPRTLRGHIDSVESVALTADARFGLSGGHDDTLRFWDLATGRCLRTIALEEESGGTASVALTPDGHFAVAGGFDGIIRFFDLENVGSPSPWSYIRPQPAAALVEQAATTRMQLNRARKLLAQDAVLEAANELRAARGVPGFQRHPEFLQAWSEVGRRGRRTQILGAWQARVLEGHLDQVTSVAMTPDARIGLSGSRDHTIWMWDLVTGNGRPLVGEGHHTDAVTDVALTPDARYGLSASQDRTVRLWELATGDCLRVLEGHAEAVNSVAITPDATFALSGSRDSVRFWDLANGRCLRRFEGHPDQVLSVDLTPDARFALRSGGSGYFARLWDIATSDCLCIIKDSRREYEARFHVNKYQPFAIMSIVITPDGRFALDGARDNTARLWDLATGDCLRILKGHTDWVLDVALTPDARNALSGGHDSTVRIWDLPTGDCLRVLQGHADRVVSVALTPDARIALSGGNDRTVRLWEIDWDYEFPEPAGWDEHARPYLERFLTLHTPYAHADPRASDGLTRRGRPSWSEDDMADLIRELQAVGYGWLRPEGVRAELESMALDWNGPPPFGRAR